MCWCLFWCTCNREVISNRKETSCLPLLNAGLEPRVSGTMRGSIYSVVCKASAIFCRSRCDKCTCLHLGSIHKMTIHLLIKWLHHVTFTICSRHDIVCSSGINNSLLWMAMLYYSSISTVEVLRVCLGSFSHVEGRHQGHWIKGTWNNTCVS